MTHKNKSRILITSALPYINGIKHLGNLVGSQLPSDVYARYCRAMGREVMYICATDEHGTPAELAAAENGMDIETYCQHMHAIQAKLARKLRLSFDHFGRSSSPQNHRLTQYFATQLANNDMIEEVLENQVYSPVDGRYLPDRYIEGTCPNCYYPDARGDQCENCTKQLNPTDLIDPRSKISGATDLEIRPTKHLYLKQSGLRDKLNNWIDSQKNWPILTTSIAKKWLYDDDGLKDRSITRDLDWGVPVKKDNKDWPGMQGKVFYVWFDAPIEYIAATAEWAALHGKPDADWQRWWRTDMGADDVYYVQFMGKDNVPFHTLSFPATIMGTNEQWKLVDYIKSFNYLNYDGGQFSTSKKRGVFINQALKILPSDYWRWWLMRNIPENSDSEFTWESFQREINKDLADILGNFVFRVTKFCRAKFGSKVPANGNYGAKEQAMIENLSQRLLTYETCMDAFELRKAAAELRAIWALGNEYLQWAQPWSLYKTSPDSAAASVRFALNLIVIYTILSEPFIPDAADKLAQAMNIKPEWPQDVASALQILPAGHAFTVPKLLFKKIGNETRKKMQDNFSGND